MVGAGSWGTTLAIVLARHQRPVVLLVRTEEEAERLRLAAQNERFLPGVPFPPGLAVSSDLSLLSQAETLTIAVPSESVEHTLAVVAPTITPAAIIVSASKGLVAAPAALGVRATAGLDLGTPANTPAGAGPEAAPATGTALVDAAAPIVGPCRLTQLIAARLPNPVCALSGPNLSREVARGLPSTTVVASAGQAAASAIQRLFTDHAFRVYTSADVVGVELGGALKNVVALAAGAADGMNLGDNAKAALITRGLAEMSRLGRVMGAEPLTFAGLAGMGDLVATCASPFSRNRRLGEALAGGQRLEEAQRLLGQVAEGVPTTRAAVVLARRAAVDMPIAEQMHAVLFEGKDPRRAVLDLMTREPKSER